MHIKNLNIFSLLLMFIVSKKAFASQFQILSAPKNVNFNSKSELTLKDITSLPFYLFGLINEKSVVIKEVPFLKRPVVFAMFAIYTNENPTQHAVSAAVTSATIKEDAALLYSNDMQLPTSDLLKASGISSSLILNSANIEQSSHLSMFADIPTDAVTAITSLPSVNGEPNPNTSPETARFVAQLRVIDALITKVVKSGLLHDANPDWLRFELHCDVVGCSDILKPILAKWISELNTASHDRAVIGQFVVQSEDGNQLVRRSLLAAEPKAGPFDNLNLAYDYDSEFPIMFNIIFWLVVVLVLVVYAIGVAMWNIDPGKDGLVYRRSYARQKRD